MTLSKDFVRALLGCLTAAIFAGCGSDTADTIEPACFLETTLSGGIEKDISWTARDGCSSGTAGPGNGTSTLSWGYAGENPRVQISIRTAREIEVNKKDEYSSKIYLYTDDADGDDSWSSPDGSCTTTIDNWEYGHNPNSQGYQERFAAAGGSHECSEPATPREDNKIDEPVSMGETTFRATFGSIRLDEHNLDEDDL